VDATFGEASAADAVIERLISRGKVEAAGVERAQRLAGDREPVYSILVKLGLVDEKDVAEALAHVLGLPLVAASEFPEEPVIEAGLSPKFLKEARALPVGETDDGVIVAMADPLDAFIGEAIELAVGRPVIRRVGVPAEIERAFERLYGGGGSPGGIRQIVEGIGEVIVDGAEEDAERLKDLASEAPVIRLVNHLISRAVDARASDIHIEPFENSLRVRYRIDGVLQEVEQPPIGLKAAIVSRVKIMAKLNIAERRLPQDGRIKLAMRGKEIDFRISTLPTMYGESVVMRILDKSSDIFDFAALGFGPETLSAYLDVLARPNGILLVTGPTGSGKTTTLYTSLLRINTPDKKILTVEDPVEYQLEGVNQVQVKPQIGLSFAHVLRSILRQDPDVIMIGEIRDLETAQIAAQAALTGHLVLSTLHTNSAASTVTRLLDMGLEDYLMASTINGVTAQRLVRSLCPACREPHPAAGALIEEMQLSRFANARPVTLFKPVGCAACSGTGYFGRTAIAEILVMSEPVRRLTLKRAEAGEIQRAAVEMGMRTLYEDGMAKAVSGLTSVEEVLRVTREA
jgi:general secretion pathway protein E